MWKRIVLLFSLSQILGAFSVHSLCAFSEERKFSYFALILSSMRFPHFFLLVSSASYESVSYENCCKFVYFLCAILSSSGVPWHFSH